MIKSLPLSLLILTVLCSPALADRGIITITTGEDNTSNIPQPTGDNLDRGSLMDGERLPVNIEKLAPSSINLEVKKESVENAIRDIPALEGFSVTGGQFTTKIDIKRKEGSHDFGAGVVIDGGLGVYVRGDKVTKLLGEDLPDKGSLPTAFGLDKKVNFQYVNIRGNSSAPTDSGVHLDKNGKVIVEDGIEGGDLDFDDLLAEDETSGKVILEKTEVSTKSASSTTKEKLTLPNRGIHPILGHLDEVGLGTSNTRFDFTTDGIRATHQIKPIGSLKRPLLLNGTAGYLYQDDIAYTTISATQYLTKIQSIENEGMISLLPPSKLTGPGKAAYNNLGGVILVFPDGRVEFLTQWVDSGMVSDYLGDSLLLPDDVSIIPALIPQQPGTEIIKIGDRIPLIRGNGFYTASGLRVIDQKTMPENFAVQSTDVLGVEDTRPTGNTQVPLYDGSRIDGTVDFDDAFVGFEVEDAEYVKQARSALYVGSNLSLGLGSAKSQTNTVSRDTTVKTTATMDLGNDGMLDEDSINIIGKESTAGEEMFSSSNFSSLDLTNLLGEVVFGGVLNLGRERFTDSSSTLRLETFANTKEDVGARSEVRLAPANSKWNVSLGANYVFDKDVNFELGFGLYW